MSLLAACLFGVPCMAGARMLELEQSKNLVIRFGGDAFVAGDALTLADFAKGELRSYGEADGWDAVTILTGGSKEDCIYYREIGVRPDRIEITWCIKFAPYQFGSSFPGHTYNLGGGNCEMRIPVEALDGVRYRAVVGDTLKPRVREGTLSRTCSEGEPLASQVRYVVFNWGERALTLDLNPPGVHSFGRKSLLTEKDWRLSREGDCFVFRADMRRVKWGDTRRFKVVFATGARPYETVHSQSKRGFLPMLWPTIRVNCGTRPVKRHKSLTAAAYSPKAGVGWLEPVEVEPAVADGLALKSVYQECLRGKGKQSVRVDAPNGLYLASFLFGSAEEASGPFNVSVDGEAKLTGVSTPRGEFRSRTVQARCRDGRLVLAFDGPKWLLGGFSLCPLAYDAEDYLLRRTWFIRQDLFDEWFARVEPVPPMPPLTPTDVAADPMGWAWNGSLTTLEASLDSSRAALDTPESVRQRLTLLKSGGFKGVVIGGLHFRFNHFGTVRYRVMLRNTRLAVQEARKLGLKVIDHWDFNWVHAPGYRRLLKVLDKDPNCLQRCLDPLQVAASFCLNSEAFVEVFLECLREHQRTTDVNGHMIDEIAWIRSQYCYCDTCRRKFHEDTGLKLPYDMRPVHEKPEHPVWRAFLAWRGRTTAALHGRLREALRQIRPDAVMLRYTSSFLCRPHHAGLELNRHPLWRVDYVGDEFHPDLVLQNWRVIFARMKNRQGATASWRNAPTWILPKFRGTPGRTLYAWALARMNRANVWYRANDYELSGKLNNWPEQMQDQQARPLSDAAVLLSQPTRDLSDDLGYYFEEHMAWLQTLAEENIQYDVILDRDVEPEKLSRYSLLVLPNVAVLSDAQAAAIRRFVDQGGRVIAAFETGLFDENGAPRQIPALAGAMNLRVHDRLLDSAAVVCGQALEDGMTNRTLTTSAPQRVVSLVDASRSEVLATNPGPAVVETAFGQGRFIYVAGNLVRQNFEPRAVSPRNATTLKGRFEYKVRFNRDINALVRNLCRRAIDADFRTRATRAPPGVVYTAFHRQTDVSDAIVLHLLNCSGKPDLRFGDKTELSADVPQPPVPHDVEFLVRSDRPIRDAFAAAPLAAGRTPVAVKPADAERYAVTVPKGALTNYAAVYLRR